MSHVHITIEKIKKSIEGDLPHLKVAIDNDFSRGDFSIRVIDMITGKTFSFHTMDLENFASYSLTVFWEKTRRELLIARGEHYTKTYVSPKKLSVSDYTYYTDAYTFTPTPMPSSVSASPPSVTTTISPGSVYVTPFKDMVVPEPEKPTPVKATKKRKKKTSYDKVQDFGIF